jgi:hypothetical protein
MAKASYGLLRDSGRVFLEAAPRGTKPTELDQAISELDGVVDVHELHVWEVTSGFPALSAHVLVSPARDCHERRAAIETLLDDRFNIQHTTLQVFISGAAKSPNSGTPKPISMLRTSSGPRDRLYQTHRSGLASGLHSCKDLEQVSAREAP